MTQMDMTSCLVALPGPTQYRQLSAETDRPQSRPFGSGCRAERTSGGCDMAIFHIDKPHVSLARAQLKLSHKRFRDYCSRYEFRSAVGLARCPRTDKARRAREPGVRQRAQRPPVGQRAVVGGGVPPEALRHPGGVWWPPGGPHRHAPA